MDTIKYNFIYGENTVMNVTNKTTEGGGGATP